MKSIKEQLLEQMEQKAPEMLQEVESTLQAKKLAEIQILKKREEQNKQRFFELAVAAESAKIQKDIKDCHFLNWQPEFVSKIFEQWKAGIDKGAYYAGFQDIWMSFEGVLFIALLNIKQPLYYSTIHHFKKNGPNISKEIKDAFWACAKNIEKDGFRQHVQ